MRRTYEGNAVKRKRGQFVEAGSGGDIDYKIVEKINLGAMQPRKYYQIIKNSSRHIQFASISFEFATFFERHTYGTLGKFSPFCGERAQINGCSSSFSVL